MKKLFALIFAGLLLLPLVACGSSADHTEAPTEAPEPDTQPAVVGGWTAASSPVVTDEVKALVEKASSQLDGADYSPVAYLASQVVAGYNHLILCTVTPVVPNAVSRYALVTIYADLNGNAEITDVKTSTATAPAPYDPDNPISGGYGTPATPEVTDAVKNAIDKANENLENITYQPKALLGMQVVAGMNYSVLCTAVEDGEPYYTVVTVYADLDGGAEITAAEGFTGADS